MGSSPIWSTKDFLAQLAEHRAFNPQVLGSIPREITNLMRNWHIGCVPAFQAG